MSFSNWDWKARWGTIVGCLGAVALAGNAIAGAEQVGKVNPFATKSFVLAQMAPLTQALEDYGAQVDRSVLGQLELKSTVLMQTQMALEQSLAVQPNDFNLKQMKKSVEKDIEQTDEEIRDLRCSMKLGPC